MPAGANRECQNFRVWGIRACGFGALFQYDYDILMTLLIVMFISCMLFLRGGGLCSKTEAKPDQKKTLNRSPARAF